ncbi:MAG: alpha amylase C-terminal domain-containing protein, partial [Verrucomicrobiota bacterium]|nr:alpha amylase C-terminal domain-containing protein [Verrucomicrobiota bacterium]
MRDAGLSFAAVWLAGLSCVLRLGAAQVQREDPGELGATVLGQGGSRTAVFRLWAPNASNVGLSGDFSNWKVDPMRPDPLRPGHWVLQRGKARPGDAYQFHLGPLTRRDPRARAVNVDANRAYLLDPREYKWAEALQWKMPPKEDLVIYEMHLGMFAQEIPGNASLFDRALKRLSYLKGLGINCIQLMPVNEFPGDRSWGYNPSDLFAIESSYGGAEGFKNFIRACHTNGIAVLLDMVHNHYGPDQIAAWQFDREAPADKGGIYFYEDRDRAMTDWGPRPDFGSPDVRRFILDSVRMFINEYKLDGFRWDSVHNIRYYQNGAHANPDGDRLLSEVNAWMQKNAPEALRIAEDHAFDSGGVGFEAQWHSSFQSLLSHLVRAPDKARDLNAFAVALENLRGWEWVNFAECHDSAGDLNEHHRLPKYIDPENPDSVRARALSLLANGIVMTIPGYPMMLQGLEMNDVEDFSDRHPLPWARAQNTHAGIVRAHADIIRLRRNLAGFTPGLKGDQLKILHCDNRAKVLAYRRSQRNAPRDHSTVVVANFSGAPLMQYAVRFPGSGTWYCQYNSGSAVYAKDFDNIGPKAGEGFALPAGQTTLPLDISRYSLLVFSKVRPPNGTATRAAFAPELTDYGDEDAHGLSPEAPFVEEIIEP